MIDEEMLKRMILTTNTIHVSKGNLPRMFFTRKVYSYSEKMAINRPSI